MTFLRWLPLFAAALIAALASAASAHPTLPTSAVVTVRPDGSVRISIHHDALAFALNDTSANVLDPDMYQLLGAPDAELERSLTLARERFLRLFALVADGKPLEVRVAEFPTVAAIRAAARGNPRPRLPIKLDIEAAATLPPGARAFTFRFPDVLAEVLVTVDRPGCQPETLPLGPAQLSPEFDTGFPQAAGGAEQPARLSALALSWRYADLGFMHIVPGGPDHALFVLGLFLLVPRIRTVLWQITAFTIAHTITLTLTSLHIIGLPASVVEPAIAATIAFIAVENLCTARVHAWRPVVAFTFGLVHGMGVATAFNEAGFPSGQLVPSLAAFTLGVEAGHVAVLAAAFLLLGWTRSKPWYRRRVALPLSLLIAACAFFWLWQRTVG